MKSKSLTFTMEEWTEVERRAREHCTKTATFIRYMAVRGNAYVFETKALPQYIDRMRVILKDINTIARKVNETGSLSATDVETLKENVTALGATLAEAVWTIRPVKI